MASGQTVSTILYSSVPDDDVESSDGTDDPYLDGPHHLQARGNLSRLSVCNSSFSCADDEDEADVYSDFYGGSGGGGGGGGGGGEGVVEGAAAVVSSYLAKLSVESFDGDADEELSDEKERLRGFGGVAELTSDSDEEPECYSLPATPPRRRSRGVGSAKRGAAGLKEYASESEGRAAGSARKYARRRIIRERFARSGNSFSEESEKLKRDEHCCYSFSGESEGGGGGLMVITRPKGGRRSLCMDLEEVKACRDLGFELEHERMVEMPSRLSINGSPLDTSSGGNSPIANWRISSPGDHPRDVKARLKVWAQAVAIASTSRHGN